MSIFSKIRNGIKDTTNALGLTDTGAAYRATQTANEYNTKANAQLDKDMGGVLNQFAVASEGRDMGTNLDQYGNQIDKSQQLTWDSINAGSSDNVQKYLNPKMDEMLQKTMQNVQGGAGAALQSSAATRTGANAVAQQYGNMWDTAYSQAMSDSQNNTNIANQYANVAGQNLDAQNQPILNWSGLTSDMATTRYNGTQGVGEAATTAAGQRDTIL